MSDKVLVVDDSGVMRKMIIRALGTCGLTDIVEASDGVEAIDRFGEHEFGLVMTDWNIPNKNGLELTQEIRAMNTDIPIMMITTESEKKAVLQAIQAGVNDYLRKPFEAEVLCERIDRLVGAKTQG